MDEATHIELTVRLWGTGADVAFEDYVAALTDLLPRHRGGLVRRIDPLDGRPGEADTILVMGFPDATAIDGFLRDPARADFEDLGDRAISRSLITDGRARPDETGPATVHPLRPDLDGS